MARANTQAHTTGKGGSLLRWERGATTPSRDDAELLDAEAACKLLGVHRNTLYRLIRTADVPALRLTRGGHWRFPRRDLLDWLEARQTRRRP